VTAAAVVRTATVAASALGAVAGGLLGCTGGPIVQSVESSLGQPSGDFPGYDERVTLYATNRARVDPTAEGWPAYPAQPPLQWSFDLNRSARAHSIDMRDTPCFQHNSCDGTDAFKRVDDFFTGTWMTMGENISAGRNVSDGFIAVHNWIYEIGAAAGETGHRENIFSAKFTLLGAGFAPGGTQLQNYWTQDFVGAPVTRPRLGDGIHFPRTVAAGAPVSFGTTYLDAASAAPVSLAVVVDGLCNPLSLVRGTAGRGAYEVKLSLGAGCHPYYFVSGTGAGAVSYPDSGALAVGVGPSAAACALFASARSDVRCDGLPDAGSVGGTSGADAAAGAPGAGGAGGEAGGSGAGGASPPDDATAGSEPDGGGVSGGGGGGAGEDGGPNLAGPAVGGCMAASGGPGGCRVAAGMPATFELAAPVLLFLIALASLLRRTRAQPAPRRRRDDA
jgi:uncharacterized protein YkwD